jgi:hypothetical protein
MTNRTLTLMVSALLASACSFHARSPNDYRDATLVVLAAKTPAIQACYDAALKTTPGLAGTVTVHFNVEKKTGKLTNIGAAAGSAPAPQPLTDCVVNSLNGLALDPPDARTGDATFDYQFAIKS